MLPTAKGALLVLSIMRLILQSQSTPFSNMGNKRSDSRSNNRRLAVQQQSHRRLDDFWGSTVPPWFDRTPAPASPVSSWTDPPTISPTDFPTERQTEYITDSPTERQTEFTFSSDSPTEGSTETVTDAATATATEFPKITDTVFPTASPVTDPPTLAPTPNVTNAPTDPLTASPTASPTGQPESYMETTTKSNGGQVTNCSYVPTSNGVSVTETLDLEYFLYLSDVAAGTTSDTTAVQAIVDTLQPQLHDALADISFNCSDISNQAFSIVKLSHDGPGSDLVGAACPLEAGPSAATSCYQVWGQMTVTMWFSGSQRRRRELQSTPFGGQAAFYQFVDWLESAFAVLPDADAGVLETEFKGFVNLGGFDGTVLSDPQQFGDSANSFIDSNKSIQNTGLPFSYGHAMIVLAGLVMVTLLVLILGRRWRNGRLVKKHLKEVDNLQLDPIEEYDEDPVIVDDASLFQEEQQLPEEFEVQLEDLHHDYRTCASPSCRACLRRKDPQFVLTDLREMEQTLERHQRRLSPMSNDVEDTQIL